MSRSNIVDFDIQPYSYSQKLQECVDGIRIKASNLTYTWRVEMRQTGWTRERLNPGPFLGESEYFCWTSPGLLHLSDHKFCLLLSSRNSSHEPSEKASNFLFCIVLDLSAFFYIYSDPDRKPPLSVISIQKYSLDTDIDLLDCMITNRGTQPPKKKKPKTSEEEGSVTTEDH
uniref:Uncharacterized protein n=1 Tax=Quercus lobata TaxID=97700 RepID=A0A7N2MZ94_QUELO